MVEKRQANSFYQHFDYEERPEVDYYTGLFNRFIFQNEPILTDFLNPRQRYIFNKIVGNEAQLYEFGGYKNAEKKRVLLCDWSQPYNIEDFNISLFSIDYNKKWDELTHSQILGSLANSGVETATFGDIISDDDKNWQFFTTKELAQYYQDQINRIGRSKVRLQQVPLKDVIEIKDDSSSGSATSISLRLDAVIANLTNYSRGQAKENLQAGNVKLNWHETQESNIIVNVHDILSIRHFGRVEITSITTTRKGKYRLEFKIWQAKKR